MRRTVWIAMFLGVALSQASPAVSARYYGFTVGVVKAPPAPVIRVAREPNMVRATDAMVFVVQDPAFRLDGDLFRYGQYWFVYTRGYWYRGRDLQGPYSVMDVRRVPRAVIGVPAKHWKHHPSASHLAAGKRKANAAAKRNPQTEARRNRGAIAADP